MASRGQVAARIRKLKEQGDPRYCTHPRCLWRSPCPKHQALAQSADVSRDSSTKE